MIAEEWDTVYRQSGLLNTSQFYGGVQNQELAMVSTNADHISGWIDLVAVLALFVGRMCVLRAKPGSFEVYVRYPVTK